LFSRPIVNDASQQKGQHKRNSRDDDGFDPPRTVFLFTSPVARGIKAGGLRSSQPSQPTHAKKWPLLSATLSPPLQTTTLPRLPLAANITTTNTEAIAFATSAVLSRHHPRGLDCAADA